MKVYVVLCCISRGYGEYVENYVDEVFATRKAAEDYVVSQVNDVYDAFRKRNEERTVKRFSLDNCYTVELRDTDENPFDYDLWSIYEREVC